LLSGNSSKNYSSGVKKNKKNEKENIELLNINTKLAICNVCKRSAATDNQNKTIKQSVNDPVNKTTVEHNTDIKKCPDPKDRITSPVTYNQPQSDFTVKTILPNKQDVG
jgi:hypothetical protein